MQHGTEALDLDGRAQSTGGGHRVFVQRTRLVLSEWTLLSLNFSHG